MRVAHANELKEKAATIQSLGEEKEKLQEEVGEVTEALEQKKGECLEMEKLLIQRNVELKFVHEDLHEEKIRGQQARRKIDDLEDLIRGVLYGSRVYHSREKKMACVEKDEYDGLRAKIMELERRVQELIDASKRDLVHLGIRKSDIGEEIVRLKKNIDLQLGLAGESKHSEEFLKIYKGTNDLFSKLISQCRT